MEESETEAKMKKMLFEMIKRIPREETQEILRRIS